MAFTNERHLARERGASSLCAERALALVICSPRVCGKREKRTGNNRPTESDGCATPESNAPPISAGSIFIPRSNYSRVDWCAGIGPSSPPLSSFLPLFSLSAFLATHLLEWMRQPPKMLRSVNIGSLVFTSNNL